MRKPVTKEELKHRIEALPTWGDPQNESERWQQRVGTVDLEKHEFLALDQPLEEITPQNRPWPSRVSLFYHGKPVYKDRYETNVEPVLLPNEVNWWKDNPDRYLIKQDTREAGGDSEFGASFYNLYFRCRLGEEAVCNGLYWRSDDGAELVNCSVFEPQSYGFYFDNVRRADLYRCRVIGSYDSVSVNDHPTSTGIKVRKGNVAIFGCFLHRLTTGFDIQWAEQFEKMGVRMEEVKLPYTIDQCRGFMTSLDHITTSKKVLLKATSSTLIFPTKTFWNVKRLYKEIPDGNGVKRQPEPTAGIEIDGEFIQLLDQGADGSKERLVSYPKKDESDRIDQLEVDVNALHNAVNALETSNAKLQGQMRGIHQSTL